jgi:GntR family transcriptional regulator
VREAVLDYDLARLVSFTDKAKAAGKKPGTELIEYHKLAAEDAPEEVQRSLKRKGKEALIYMERVRLADGVPVIYERRHVVASLCPSLNKTHAKGSLYGCWTERDGLSISGAEEIIRAVNATKAQAAMLKVPVGAACFLIAATGFIEGGEPLWQEETLYRADVYEFRNRIGGVVAASPALGRIR